MLALRHTTNYKSGGYINRNMQNTSNTKSAPKPRAVLEVPPVSHTRRTTPTRGANLPLGLQVGEADAAGPVPPVLSAPLAAVVM